MSRTKDRVHEAAIVIAASAEKVDCELVERGTKEIKEILLRTLNRGFDENRVEGLRLERHGPSETRRRGAMKESVQRAFDVSADITKHVNPIFFGDKTRDEGAGGMR